MDGASRDHLKVRTNQYLNRKNLKLYMLPLPLKGNSAAATVEGIRSKIFRNRSLLVTASNSADSILAAGGTPVDNDETLAFVQKKILSLLDPGSKGMVLIVAEAAKNRSAMSSSDSNDAEEDRSFLPIGGGVIEYVDASERQIWGLWCRRSLDVSARTGLIKVLCLRTLAEALWNSDCPTLGGMFSETPSNRLISIPEKLSVAFPVDANVFLRSRDGVGLLCHAETALGRHNDVMGERCPCLKAQAEAKELDRFWGISLNRFFQRCKAASFPAPF